MFVALHSDINFHKSGLLYLTGQPDCKKSRSAKVKDGIINLFLRSYLVDWYIALYSDCDIDCIQFHSLGFSYQISNLLNVTFIFDLICKCQCRGFKLSWLIWGVRVKCYIFPNEERKLIFNKWWSHKSEKPYWTAWQLTSLYELV